MKPSRYGIRAFVAVFALVVSASALWIRATAQPVPRPGITVPQVSLAIDPSEGKAPLQVRLRGNAVDMQGTIVKYAWSFVNSQVVDATGRVSTYFLRETEDRLYEKPGRYEPAFRVTDLLGNTVMATGELRVWKELPTPTPVARVHWAVH